MDLRFCPNCGASVVAKSTQCVSCGASLVNAAPRSCPKCGNAVLPTSVFCASCGAAIGAAPSPGESSMGTGTAPAPGLEIPGPPSTTPASTAADRKALRNTASAAILGIAGFVLSIAGVGFTLSEAYFGSLGHHSWDLFYLTVFGLIASLGAFGLIVSLIELWLMREAFGALAPFDTQFSTPRDLTPAAMAGVVLVVAGILSLVVYGTASYTGLTLALIALLLVGASLAIIGFFALAIGVWRMGERFDEDLFRVGAVLLVVLGVVGMVLILVAARSARRRLGALTPSRASA